MIVNNWLVFDTVNEGTICINLSNVVAMQLDEKREKNVILISANKYNQYYTLSSENFQKLLGEWRDYLMKLSKTNSE